MIELANYYLDKDRVENEDFTLYKYDKGKFIDPISAGNMEGL